MKNLTLIALLFIGFQSFAQNDFEIANRNTENNQIDPIKIDYQFVENIPYIETEEEFVLGFDTAKYLPIGYNPAVYYGDLLLPISYVDADEAEHIFVYKKPKYQILKENDRKILNSIDYIKLEELSEVEKIFSQAERNFLNSIQYIESTEI